MSGLNMITVYHEQMVKHNKMPKDELLLLVEFLLKDEDDAEKDDARDARDARIWL